MLKQIDVPQDRCGGPRTEYCSCIGGLTYRSADVISRTADDSMRLRHQQADLLFFFIRSLWKMKLEALHHTAGDAEELLGVEGLCLFF